MFNAAKSIGRVAVRGNREYSSGYDMFRVRIEVLAAPIDAGADASADRGGDGGAKDVLWSKSVVVPGPMSDVDVANSPPVMGYGVRVVSEADESIEPGLAEVEVFEN